METIKLMRHAKKLFNNDMVPERVNRHNRRQWVLSVKRLGTRWLLHPVNQPKKLAHV